MKLSLLLTLILSISTCNMQDNSTYTYADGSGNTYRLQKRTLKYNPMTPEMSSSGTYSGGKKQEVQISGSEKKQLIEAFQEAVLSANKNAKREMGTGMLLMNGKKYIIARGSPAQRSAEKLLRSFLDE